MLHIIPILCIVAFVFIVELQLKKQVEYLKEELDDLFDLIKKNKKRIIENQTKIAENKENISKNSEKITLLTNDSKTTD